MKKVFFLTIFVFICFNVYGQIKNGSFEDWESIQNFERPEYWETNQDSNLVRFERDTISIEGNYSLKIRISPRLDFQKEYS